MPGVSPRSPPLACSTTHRNRPARHNYPPGMIPRVVAAAGAGHHLRALHRLRIDDGGGRRPVAAGRCADPFAQRCHASARWLRRPAICRPSSTRSRRAGSLRQRPPHRPVVREVADRVQRCRACSTGRGGRPARPATPGRAVTLADRPFRVGHVRGIPAGTGAAGDLARAAPARHTARGRSWLDITRGGTVQRHARLLASRWTSTPNAITRSLLRHNGDTPRQPKIILTRPDLRPLTSFQAGS